MAVSSPQTAPVRISDVKADIRYEGEHPLMPERDLVSELKALGFHPKRTALFCDRLPFLGAGFRCAAVDCDVISLFGKAQGDGRADPLAGAGDDCCFSQV